jgi:hypothetical protein
LARVRRVEAGRASERERERERERRGREGTRPSSPRVEARRSCSRVASDVAAL